MVQYLNLDPVRSAMPRAEGPVILDVVSHQFRQPSSSLSRCRGKRLLMVECFTRRYRSLGRMAACPTTIWLSGSAPPSSQRGHGVATFLAEGLDTLLSFTEGFVF